MVAENMAAIIKLNNTTGKSLTATKTLACSGSVKLERISTAAIAGNKKGVAPWDQKTI